MGNASVEPQLCFSDATCDQLTEILLAGASCASNGTVPATLIDRLTSLRTSDDAFRRWAEEHLASETAHAQPAHLAKRLFQSRDWMETTDSSCAPPARRLIDTAGLVLRLKSLESNFAMELAAQKRQALYNFAYGLSHELNNPLANIATRAGVLAQNETSKQRANLLKAIVDNAMRGSEMLGDLMLVARPPEIRATRTDLREFITSMAERASVWASPYAVRIELDHGCDGTVMIDPTAMREAVWTLVRNGIEAMPAGGQLTIRTSCSDCVSGLGTYVVEIADEGQGLSASALENCFDPYFSGREAGRGLGLGLSKAWRLIDLHGGRLTLANRPGTGCVARIELSA